METLWKLYTEKGMIYFTFVKDRDPCGKESVPKQGCVPEDYVNVIVGSRRQALGVWSRGSRGNQELLYTGPSEADKMGYTRQGAYYGKAS